MTRKYTLVIQDDSSGYSAYVPELPTILVTGNSPEDLDSRATKAIRHYWGNRRLDRSPTAMLREIEMDLLT